MENDEKQNNQEIWKEVKKKRVYKSSKNVMSADKCYQLENRLNIFNLTKTLLSDYSIKLQKDGWKIYKILKPQFYTEEDLKPQDTEDTEYKTIIIDNPWEDVIIFERKKIKELEPILHKNTFDVLDIY